MARAGVRERVHDQGSDTELARVAVVSAKGARRWANGHPWIYRSDIARRPASDAGAVRVVGTGGRPLGWALWSPASQISLRLLDRDSSRAIDAGWWRSRIAASLERRAELRERGRDMATAYRLVHGEGDGCPSLICDRYDRWLIVQMMSAGLERFRSEIVAALRDLTGAEGILARNDAPPRAKENLPLEVALLDGIVPDEIEVVEGRIRYAVAPWTGQKTGAFLDQRENRLMIGEVARGEALDCFGYHGSFALHMAGRARRVTSIDSSAPALARARENAERNGITNISFIEANAFEFLRARNDDGTRFDTVVLDPPAFAKSRASVRSALRGYKEINLRAMRILAPRGLMFTASCSHHVTRPLFLEMLQDAAADSGRTIMLRRLTGQPPDHPELLTVPETSYLKGALLQAID
ncbi:MAG: class I SAM-dependent rRNA methyltransferase [Gemmatimonadaceae bacterium]